MKRAIGLIAATLLTTSVYSQDYSSSGSSSNPDSTPDYRSRQSESGAPASGEYSSSSSAGYDKAPGLSGGNSSTGQSNGANVGTTSDQDQSLTTRDSDLSGSEYRGTLPSEDSNVGSSGNFQSGSSSETNGELNGSGTADGAFHEPAAPVREGQHSEGWSGADTFSGAGPGSISGSASSTDSSSSTTIPSPTESSNNFSSDVSNNSALSNRDQDLRDRGLEPDSNQLDRSDAFSNREQGDMNNDDTLILEDWTVVTPPSDTNVGAPAESESGSSSGSSEVNPDQFDSTVSSSDSYSRDLYQRVQKDWSARLGTTDVPATPGMMNRSLDELKDMRFYNGTTQSDVGAPGSSVSGSGKSSDDDAECDTHKGKGSAGEYQQGEESSSKYHINRGEDEKYHINREASGDRSDTSAPSDYGDRPDSSNYDDGHLNGDNAAGSSGSSQNSSDSSSKSSDDGSRSTDGALTKPDL